MRNISVPTNDMMIYAVHGNTVDECIADCAKLMAYLTKGAQPENDTVDDDDTYNRDDYDDYELDDDDEDDDTVDDDDILFDEAIDNLYFRIRNLNDKDFSAFVFELYVNDILDDSSNVRNCWKYRTAIFGYLNDYFDEVGSFDGVDYINRMIDNL